MRVSLVDRAHRAIAAVLHPGDIAVDATVGNGHDTRFLAEAVGPDGRVYGFDIQPAAIAAARARLEQAGLEAQVVLLQRSHGDMAAALPGQARGRVRAVMFNLGYLPGSDKRVITASESTLAALEQSLELLAPGGRISVLAYTGHPGGREEAEAVKAWAAGLDGSDWEVDIDVPPRAGAPERILIGRLPAGR